MQYQLCSRFLKFYYKTWRCYKDIFFCSLVFPDMFLQSNEVSSITTVFIATNLSESKLATEHSSSFMEGQRCRSSGSPRAYTSLGVDRCGSLIQTPLQWEEPKDFGDKSQGSSFSKIPSGNPT